MRDALRPRDARDRVDCCAWMVPSLDEARRLIRKLGDKVSFYKLGMQLVFAGRNWRWWRNYTAPGGKRTFLDMKLLRHR